MGGGSSQSSRAVQLPASGRNGEGGGVETQQSAAAGQGSVATINSSVQVSGDYSGSVPAANTPAGPITLTLANALKRGLDANLGTISATNSVRASRAQRIQSLSAMLPDISANASETVTQVDLAAYGLQVKVPGFNIPSVVGPYAYSQAQAALSQSVFDLVNRRNWQAAKQTEQATALSAKDARELVVMAVGGTYLQILATQAQVESQKAQVANSQAIYNQAQVRKSAGTNSRIDVMRSLVEFETEQQRLSSIESDLKKQKIAFARILGLPLDRELILEENLSSAPVSLPESNASIQKAFQLRSDLRAAEAQVRAAETALSAAHAERLPSISLSGDYGVIGPNPTSTHGVFSVTGTLNVPIWQGGRVRGDIEQAEATLHQRQAELADQRGAVEQQVRTALVELETAAGQVKVAETNRGYASETLTEARDRFAAGVATTVEVVQAQEQVASAENDYISSLFSYDLARLTLARATGGAEAELPDLLKGNRP